MCVLECEAVCAGEDIEADECVCGMMPVLECEGLRPVYGRRSWRVCV